MKTNKKYILGVAGLALFTFGAVAMGCSSKRTASGTKPTTVTGGTAGKKTMTDAGATKDPDADTATCTDAEDGLCVCVPGGFVDEEGAIWDFACCFSKSVYYFYCGDDSTGCDPTTFACGTADSSTTTGTTTAGSTTGG